MSSTITQVEQRTVPQSSPEPLPTEKIVLKKREIFARRSTSIEKFKKFNSYICSQHYLPSLLFWLTTSQTIITSNMEKFIIYIKSLFLILTIRECLEKVKKLDYSNENNFSATILQLTAKDLSVILNIFISRIKFSFSLICDDIQQFALVASIYLGVFLVFFQMVGCTMLLFFKLPSLGFLFLVGCVLLMSKVAAKVMFQNIWLRKEDKLSKKLMAANPEVKTIQERRRIRKQLNLIGKTISNVKLF